MKVCCFLMIPIFLSLSCHTNIPDPVEPVESVVVRAGQMYALVNGQEWRTCGPVTAPKAFAQLFVAEYFDMVEPDFAAILKFILRLSIYREKELTF